MKMLAAIMLPIGLALPTSSLQAQASASLVGNWCLERPPLRVMKYGSRLGLAIDRETDSTLTGQYNWIGADPLNTRFSAKSAGNLWEFWPEQKIWYRLEKHLDARGRLVGTGGNNALKMTWPAIFNRVSDVVPSVDKEKHVVVVPDCPK